MTRESTDALIERLGRDLPPVRPIPRLRVVLAAAAGLALLGALFRFAQVAPRADLTARLHDSASFACVAIALALLALGAALTATAASVPGRERLANAGRGLGALGFVLSFGALVASDALRLPIAADFRCLLGGFVAGAAAAAWLGLFTRWGAASQRARATAAGIAAGVAAGALAVHASCPANDSMHWFFGHAAAPLLAGLLALLLFRSQRD